MFVLALHFFLNLFATFFVVVSGIGSRVVSSYGATVEVFIVSGFSGRTTGIGMMVGL